MSNGTRDWEYPEAGLSVPGWHSVTPNGWSPCEFLRGDTTITHALCVWVSVRAAECSRDHEWIGVLNFKWPGTPIEALSTESLELSVDQERAGEGRHG